MVPRIHFLLLLALVPYALGATFVATNLAVVRVGASGGSSSIVAGTATAVFVDEYTTAAAQSAPVQSIPVTGGVNVCTLSHNVTVPGVSTWAYDQEGIPSLSTNGAFLSFPCYTTAIAATLAVAGAKVATVVSYTASVYTTTTAVIATGTGTATRPQALRQVVSNGAALWWYVESGSAAASKNIMGLFYTSTLGSTTLPASVCVWGGSCIGSASYYVMGSVGWGFSNTALMYTDSSSSPYPSTGGLNSFTAAIPTTAATGTTLAGAVAYPYKPYGFVWASAVAVWMTETTALTTNNIAQYTGTGIVWNRQTPTAALLIESGTMIISIAGRNETIPNCAFTFMLYLTSPSKLYSYNTATDVKLVLATAPTYTVFRGVTPAPFSIAPTFTGVCATTPTPSVTPSPATSFFVSSNLAVVRVGVTSTPIVAGIAQPVFVDQYTTATGQAAPVSSIPMVGTNLCTLSHAVTVPGTSTWAYDQEGIPLLATTGAFLSFPCYNIQPGVGLSSTALKVAAVVSYNSTVNTTTTVPGTIASTIVSTTYVQALRQVASDGTSLWWSLSTGGSTGTAGQGAGLYYTSPIGTNSQPLITCGSGSGTCIGLAATNYNVGAIGWGFGNTALMYTDSASSPTPSTGGLNSFTSALTPPTSAGTGTTLAGAVSYPFKPFGFVWAFNTTIWMTETANTTSTNIAQYTGSGTTWTRQTPTATMLIESGTMIISIAGRSELCGAFMLYLTSPTKLYSYNTASDTKLVLATAPTNTVFRGVTAAPYSTAPSFVGAASCSGTATSTTTQTPSGTPTPTAAPFTATNLAVVRVGSGTAAIVAGIAQSVFVDQYTTAAGQAAPVSTVLVNGANTCTLSAVSSSSWLYDQEGIPSLSTNGAFLTFPCYKVTAGTALTASAINVAAIVSYNSAVNTATSGTIITGGASATYPQALRTTVSNGVNIWWAVQSATATYYSQLLTQTLFSTTSTMLCAYPSAYNAAGTYLEEFWHLG